MNKIKISIFYRINLVKVLEKDFNIDKATSVFWVFKDPSCEDIIQDFYPNLELTAFNLALD